LKNLVFLLLLCFESLTFGMPTSMPLFNELPIEVQQDISLDLKTELKLSPTQLAEVTSNILLVADITRAMPGIDQGYLAIVEEPTYGDIRARFDIAIVYGTQGSVSGILANLINYSINN